MLQPKLIVISFIGQFLWRPVQYWLLELFMPGFTEQLLGLHAKIFELHNAL